MEVDSIYDQPSDCCFRCAKALRLGVDNCYLIKVEALADPSPPIVSSDVDIRRRIENLIEQMADLSPQEAMDQVYRRLSFYLCEPCYRHWIENPVG
jgi:hypothetical protein